MMGVVPLLLDKSIFQGLSARELICTQRYFLQTLPPVLVLELVGDLKKAQTKKSPKQAVAEIARKFGGSGEPITAPYREMLSESLLGNPVPMTGQIPIDSGDRIPLSEGGYALSIQPQPLNYLILRLAAGKATPYDDALAARWRESAQHLTLRRLDDFLRREHVIFAPASSLDELRCVVDGVLDEPGLQDIWVTWLLQQESRADLRRAIALRWSFAGGRLASFAPYAHHCLRCLLLLHAGSRSHLLPKWEPTHLVDVQYLYYAPFCSVFSSTDRVHTSLGPLVMREYQRFLPGPIFKQSVRAICDHFDGLPDSERQAVLRELGCRPPHLRGNPLVEAWDALFPPDRKRLPDTPEEASARDRRTNEIMDVMRARAVARKRAEDL